MDKGFFRNLAKFIGKHLCQGRFFNRVAGQGHRCFPVNFVKFLGTSFLQNTSGRLLLYFLCYLARRSLIKLVLP